MQETDTTDNETYDCPDCDYSTDSEKGVKIHHSQKHKEGSMKKEYECENCGETFEDFPSRIETRGRENFYCSVECKHEGEAHEDTYYKECVICGGEVYVPPSLQDEMGEYDLERKTCSKECESKWKRMNWTGEDHPSWHGGSPDYYGENWMRQARKARERDDHKCRKCGETADRALDVHHIEPFDSDKPAKPQNELDNLVSLCRSCHRSVELSDQTTDWR